jgi:hypothetical protein
MFQVNQHQSPFYLCTGFHRSGTSLLAQSLAQGGTHMGDELMGASFSNPLGHVEDMPVVRLHDKILEINGADWRYCQQSPLVIPQWFVPYIQRYITQSTEDNDICGVKDPRAAFFLDNWEQAAQGNIRYILVYRHWAPSCFSIFNRASKHLINNTAPLAMNKVNLSFWRDPGLAFNMWQVNNQAILDFYARHSDKCLLIAQDAFVHNNANLGEMATKIGLDASFFDNGGFEQQLMTEKVPDYFFALLSDEHKQRLDETWRQLQQAADVAALNLPDVVPYEQKISLNQLGFVEKVTDVSDRPPLTFNIESLGWQEALGFTSQIPKEAINTKIFDALMQRPFTGSEHYQALAKITHKHGLYLYTKLCKMRAMQIEYGSWQVAKWGVFVEPHGTWLQHSDESLEQSNPFSLRFKDDLTNSRFSHSDIEFINADWVTIQQRLTNVVGPLQLARLLELVLLYRFFEQAQHYVILSQFARQNQFWVLAEFALIKALRLEYKADFVMALGDIYNSQNMWVKAFQCFTQANNLDPQQPAIMARLADVCLSLGEVDKAKRFLLSAQQLAPQHKVVQFCQKRMAQLSATTTKVTQSVLADESELWVMPSIEHYQDIVELTQQNRQAGEALDKVNQQVSFILRDNKQWLLNGLNTLSEAAARCLSSLIFQHWLKLWPEATLFSALDVPYVSATRHFFATDKSDPPMTLAFVIHIDNTRVIPELMAFVDRMPYRADLLISCKEADKEMMLEVSKDYVGGKVFIETVGDEVSHLQAWLSTHQLKQDAYDLICKIHGVKSIAESDVVNWGVQQMFSLLSPHIVDKIMDGFRLQKELGMVVPGYHPKIARKFSTEEYFQKLTLLANKFNLAQQSKIRLPFPAGGMFWYRPQALALMQSSLTESLRSADLLQVLPLMLKQHHYTTQCSHLL